jgi:hypothetical protein
VGKGKIVSVENRDYGDYWVQPIYNIDLVERRIAIMDDRITEMTEELEKIQQKINELQIDYGEAEAKYDTAVAEFIDELKAALAAGGSIPDTSEYTSAYADAYKLSVELIELERQRDLLQISKDILQADRDKLDSSKEAEGRQAWCADLTTTIGMDSEVATVEIPGEHQYLLIYPQGKGDGAHSPDRDGVLTPREWATPEQAYWCAAALPGWQRFRPNYRTGEISGIGKHGIIGSHGQFRLVDGGLIKLPEKASVEERGEWSSVDSLPIHTGPLDASPNITGATAHYLTQDMGAFLDGDRVLVQFQALDRQQPRVIGFEKEPRGEIGGGGIDWTNWRGDILTYAPGTFDRYRGQPGAGEKAGIIWHNGRRIAKLPGVVLGAALTGQDESRRLVAVFYEGIAIEWQNPDRAYKCVSVDKSKWYRGGEENSDFELLWTHPGSIDGGGKPYPKPCHFSPAGTHFVSVIGFVSAHNFMISGNLGGMTVEKCTEGRTTTAKTVTGRKEDGSLSETAEDTWESSGIMAADYDRNGSRKYWRISGGGSNSRAVTQLYEEEEVTTSLKELGYNVSKKKYWHLKSYERQESMSESWTETIDGVGTHTKYRSSLNIDFSYTNIAEPKEWLDKDPIANLLYGTSVDTCHSRFEPSSDVSSVSGSRSYGYSENHCQSSLLDMRVGTAGFYHSSYSDSETLSGAAFEPTMQTVSGTQCWRRTAVYRTPGGNLTGSSGGGSNTLVGYLYGGKIGNSAISASWSGETYSLVADGIAVDFSDWETDPGGYHYQGGVWADTVFDSLSSEGPDDLPSIAQESEGDLSPFPAFGGHDPFAHSSNLGLIDFFSDQCRTKFGSAPFEDFGDLEGWF